MQKINRESLQGVLDEQEAEISLLRILLMSLVSEHPNREKVIASFQRETEDYCKLAPPGTNPEYLVEVMARLQLYLSILK